MTIPNIQQHPASVDAYIRHGWSLVPIPFGTKGPRVKGWNRKDRCIVDQSYLSPGNGIGLAHAYSGTMALDIDRWEEAHAFLSMFGVDLQSLYDAPDAVSIHSGRPGHGKLLYAMPFGLALPSKKLAARGPDGQGYNYLDFRCATANGLTVQDVLPPSIHPDTGQSYSWSGRGHWTRLPVIPQPLLDIWQSLLDQEREKCIESDGVSVSWDDIRQVLDFIPADVNREEWIAVGMALHWAGSQINQTDQALILWDEWSRESETKYPGQRAIRTQWESFRADKTESVKLGSLFHIARQHGWIRPAPDVSQYFAKLNQSPTSPTALLLSLRPPPPNMDLTLWPGVLATRAQEIADCVGCDPLAPLWAGLGAICGVVDARIRLELMPGYQVPPILWLMTIGAPADKKTPGSYPMLSSLATLEIEDRPRFKKELLDWEGKEAGYEAAKKTFLEWSASPDAMLGGNPPPVPDLPAQPVPVKITVSDITSQKLVRHVAERPRGLLCYLDEMAAWVRKMTDAKSGEDRSAWVVAYESKPYEMDRVGAGSIHCDNMAVSIYGNLQPKVLQDNLKSLSSDGLLQRFIPAILRDVYTRVGNPLPECMTTTSTWENTLRLIYSLPPQVYRLSEAAYNEYRQFQHWYEQTKQEERLIQTNDVFMTAFGKIEGTTGRLILLQHLMESPFNPMVDVTIAQRVITLIKQYVIPAFRYIFAELGDSDSFDRWITDHIIHYSDTSKITLSEIKRSARRHLDGTANAWAADQKVFGSMQLLESAGWVVRIDDGAREHQHIAEWAINPALPGMFSDYRRKVIEIKQQRARERGLNVSVYGSEAK